MNFVESLEKMGFEKNNIGFTENGMIGYKEDDSKLVTLNFRIPSMRNGLDRDLFEEAYREDPNLALRWMLYVRDIRGGVGERNLFKQMLKHLAVKDPDLLEKIIKEIPLGEYGRWDDILILIERSRIGYVVAMKIKEQLEKDLSTKTPSLMAKWLPSENTHSRETRYKGRILRQYLGYTSKEYRKILSHLRKTLKVVERDMSGNNWHKINYSHVPSKANLIYSKAFIRNDEARRREYLDSLVNGKSKINSSVLFPHEIVHKAKNASKREDTALYNEMWKALGKVEGFTNTLVVRDGSGSMLYGGIPNSSVSALSVADAITLYCAENNEGEFKNTFITFSSNAEFVRIKEKSSLTTNLKLLSRYDDFTNTNIRSVFEMILAAAVSGGMSQKDLPKTVLIISDMEFDAVDFKYKGFKDVEERFKESGFEIPKLVFWNVCSRTNTIPMKSNENGLVLISGFSKNLLQMVMSSELSPYKALKKELMKERYSCIDKLFN